MAFPTVTVERLELSFSPAPRSGPLCDVLETIWDRQPSPVALMGGHWRWRGPREQRDEVRRLMARTLGPRSLVVDPNYARRLELPPTEPSSRPCEVTLYPVLLGGGEADSAAGRTVALLDLCLFYCMTSGGREPGLADRARGYYRVIETLDRLYEETCVLYPRARVRAVDLPMPGWMGAQLNGTSGNLCRLLMA